MTSSVALPAGALLRQLEPSDAPAMLDAYIRNREHLRPFEPERPDSFFTLDGQQSRLDSLLTDHHAGRLLANVIVRDGRVLGSATLNTIVRGPFRSASLGYWVDAAELRQGLASAAVAALCGIADQELQLHRIEASTLLTNLASQRVLVSNDFVEFGVAPSYLHIAGEWRDFRLFQRILNDRLPGQR